MHEAAVVQGEYAGIVLGGAVECGFHGARELRVEQVSAADLAGTVVVGPARQLAGGGLDGAVADLLPGRVGDREPSAGWGLRIGDRLRRDLRNGSITMSRPRGSRRVC